MLTVKISREDVSYVVEVMAQATLDVKSMTVKSLHDMVYTLGRLAHINDVHFFIPSDLETSLVKSLQVEYPGEVYEHRITVQ